MSARTVQRLPEQGWQRPHRGVYALPGSTPGDERAGAAALLAAGPGAVLASWTAARLAGLTETHRRPVRVLVPHGSHRPQLRGVHIAVSRTLTDADVIARGALRYTRPERTLCDLAAECSAPQLAELIAVAVQLRLTTTERVDAVHRRLGPRPGSGRMHAALAALTGTGRTDSPLERKARRLLAAAGFTPEPGTYALRLPDGGVVHLDIAFPAQRVAIEVDGFAWHRTPEQLRRDHARQNRITAAGWTLLRMSYADLLDPTAFLAQLRRVLQR